MQNNKLFSFPDWERFKAIALYGTIATIFFVVIYGQCNLMASHSAKHYALYTDWELNIPLIPWMIYPYISLNALFVMAAFVVKNPQSVKGLCLSIAWGAVIAGFIFFFFPGKLGFTREEAIGYEKIFQFMFSIDHPHNLYPSLHITYSCLCLWVMIEQTRSKLFHWIAHIWLLLITLSVVLVHQHHLFDIVTGAILAVGLYRFVYLRYRYA